MNQVTRIKSIYAAIARPGAGKTERLLAEIPSLIAAGKLVVLALPTLILSDDIKQRAEAASISARTIDHRAGELVVTQLEDALLRKVDTFIICTHESIRKVKPALLHDWTLVIDELPKVVEYHDYSIKPVELHRVLEYTYEENGKLQLKENLIRLVQEQVDTNRADSLGTDCSTLGDSAAQIFRLLLIGEKVFIDKPQKSGARYIRAVEELSSWWDIFSAADETHLLAANIVGSEFELFANVNGFKIKASNLTPEAEPYTSPVIIYPIMPKGINFSKTRATSPHGDARLIDLALKKALDRTQSTPLLAASQWARFEHIPGIHYVKKDCRGLNKFHEATEAILLFNGNPSPSDKLGIEYLKDKYNLDFESAFLTSRLLEPALQVATRTAIRSKSNTQTIRLYVQDERVANYLVNSYLEHAVIDWTLSNEIPIKQDGRKLAESTEMEITNLLRLNTPVNAINRLTGVSKKKIREIRDFLEAA